MSVVYRKIPLGVTAVFMPDGELTPKGLTYEDSTFQIDKVISKIPRAPRVVKAVAPIEYTVMIRGREKKIYYEADTNTWFSVRETYT